MNKVLIVDDDKIVANIYRNKFLVEGFNAEIALDGQAGLDLIRSFRPDAVLLDLMLPQTSGLEVLKTIRSEPELQRLPVIIFSNTYLTSMVQEAWVAGATKCLSKANCTPKQVIDIVRSALAGSDKQTETVQPPAETPIPFLAEPTAAQGAASDSDEEFLNDLRNNFIKSLPGTLGSLRGLLQGITKAEKDEPLRLKQIQEMCHHVHTLTGSGGIVGLHLIAQMSDALEALLKELHEKPKNLNASTVRTVASAVDFLGILFEHGILPEKQRMPPANILVVDDEAISRRAVTFALGKAKLAAISAEDGEAAYKLISEKPFDLIILDVDMPGMSGFELCAKLRTLPAHKKTPVVFVTSLTNFESRANSTMSGGTDFIAKPFLFVELAVKTLVYVLRCRLER